VCVCVVCVVCFGTTNVSSHPILFFLICLCSLSTLRNQAYVYKVNYFLPALHWQPSHSGVCIFLHQYRGSFTKLCMFTRILVPYVFTLHTFLFCNMLLSLPLVCTKSILVFAYKVNYFLPAQNETKPSHNSVCVYICACFGTATFSPFILLFTACHVYAVFLC
jgi:hypothetical protein